MCSVPPPFFLELLGDGDSVAWHRVSCWLTRKQAGYTHAFVVEFASEEDRKYYVEEDPAHWEFKKSLKGLMPNVGVMDFTPGEY